MSALAWSHWRKRILQRLDVCAGLLICQASVASLAGGETMPFSADYPIYQQAMPGGRVVLIKLNLQVDRVCNLF